jgi:hypothetical protein
MLPASTPSIVLLGPIPRAVTHVPQVATLPRRVREATIRSML